MSDIYVTGMPLMFRGFNGRYNGGGNRYDLVSHNYWGLHIRHVYFKKNEETDCWEFHFAEDWDRWGALYTKAGDLCGDWGEFRVRPKNDMAGWWDTNGLYITMAVGMVALVKYLW